MRQCEGIVKERVEFKSRWQVSSETGTTSFRKKDPIKCILFKTTQWWISNWQIDEEYQLRSLIMITVAGYN